MANSRNYYERFQEFIDNATIDDLLARTVGYHQSRESVFALNEWVRSNVKPDANVEEFDDLFNDCMVSDEALWFNLSWALGWAAGAVNALKSQGADIQFSVGSLFASVTTGLDGD